MDELRKPEDKLAAQIRREVAEAAISYYLGDQVRAAKALGVPLKTLLRYLKGKNRG